jgi:hypothetical protein
MGVLRRAWITLQRLLAIFFFNRWWQLSLHDPWWLDYFFLTCIFMTMNLYYQTYLVLAGFPETLGTLMEIFFEVGFILGNIVCMAFWGLYALDPKNVR